MAERWPPVYDAEDLASTIRKIVEDAEYKAFYVTTERGPSVCQGDVVRLVADFPLIDGNGTPTAEDSSGYWLVVGNTCDFDREDRSVRFTQFAPIVEVDRGGNPNAVRSVKRYESTRSFFLPPWNDAQVGKLHAADLMRPVSVEKGVFAAVASVESRLSSTAWFLLHACLVRFLCRDDGRFDGFGTRRG